MHALRPGDILLIHDNSQFTTTVAEALIQAKHSVMTCSSGAEARVLFGRSNFDVVLCAQKLPDEEGLALCRFLKDQPDYQFVTFCLIVPDAARMAAGLTARSASPGGQADQKFLPD